MSDYRLRRGHHEPRNLWEHHHDEAPEPKAGHCVGQVFDADLAAEIVDAVNARRAAQSDGTRPLRERVANAARNVPLTLGPNTLATAQSADPIRLSGRESGDIADAIIAVLTAELRRATGMDDNVGDLLELGADEILAALRDNEAVLHERERRAQEAEAVLDHVRELHRRQESDPVPVCHECRDRDGNWEHWPCETIRAIAPEEDPADE